MAYVIAICANQAEAIESSLPDDIIRPYNIHEILPRGDEDLAQSKYRTGLTNGSRTSLGPLIDNSSRVFSAIQKVAWSGSPTAFGCVVWVFKTLYTLMLIVSSSSSLIL